MASLLPPRVQRRVVAAEDMGRVFKGISGASQRHQLAALGELRARRAGVTMQRVPTERSLPARLRGLISNTR